MKTKFDIEDQVLVDIQNVGQVCAIVVGIGVWRDRTVEYKLYIPTFDITIKEFEDNIQSY